jgi:hypothetical protein
MLSLPLAILLPLPPLAFGPAQTEPLAFQPPWELTCRIGELGRPRIPPLRPPGSSRRMPLPPETLRPRSPDHLVGPVTDAFLFLGLAVWSSSTGGQVAADAWPDPPRVSSPLLAPSLGLPPPPSTYK